MVYGKRVIAGGELGAAQIGKLLGMELDRKPEFPCRGKDLLRLGNRESDAFAKAIDRIGKLRLGDGWHGLAADEIDIGGMIVAIFGGKSMGAEIARDHIDKVSLP